MWKVAWLWAVSFGVAQAATLRVGPGQAYTNLFGAVQAANSGDVILVDPGAYAVNRTVVIDVSLTIRGNGGVPSFTATNTNVFEVTSGTVVLEDLLITPTGASGVRMTGGTLTMSRVTVSGNRTGPEAGGAGLDVVSATSVTLVDSVFADNRSQGGGFFTTAQGGCVRMAEGTLTVRGSTFDRCRAQQGGALWLSATASAVIDDSQFISNAAVGPGSIGGAIRAEGPLTVRTSRFTDNRTNGNLLLPGFGGAVQAAFGLTLEDSVFTDNRTDGTGGAVRLSATSGATLLRNLFCGNVADGDGGAVSVSPSTQGWELRNNLFVENSSPQGGAVSVYDDGSGTSPTGGVLRNNHVLGNAGTGGAFNLLSARVSVENNLFAGNEAAALDDGVGVLNYNGWYDNDSDLDGRAYGANDVRNADPRIAVWSVDGDCANDDFTLRAGSPMFNTGNPAIVDPDGSRSDIGAYGGPGAPIFVDDDQDGFGAQADCDDQNAAVFPGAAETCDGVDQDCDGVIDSPAPANAALWFPDTDGDGHGVTAGSVRACARPAGFSAVDDDCNDRRGDVHPTAVEVCDGIDNDCDALVDGDDAGDLPEWFPDNDGDGFGRPVAQPVQGCEAPPNTVANGDDCDDGDAERHPGRAEVCDGVDQDCDGTADDDPEVGLTFYPDADSDGWGDAGGETRVGCSVPDGFAVSLGDCDDDDRDVHPLANEPCDPPRDLNCDGASGSDDNDDDGHPACEDCDDFDSSRYPGADDTWYDGVVTDCDRSSDYDADGDGFDAPQGGGPDCDDEDASVHPGATDLAGDGRDADCDGEDAAVIPGGTDTDTEPDDDDDVKAACGGCDGAGGAGAWALLGLLALRRRR